MCAGRKRQNERTRVEGFISEQFLFGLWTKSLLAHRGAVLQ